MFFSLTKVSTVLKFDCNPFTPLVPWLLFFKLFSSPFTFENVCYLSLFVKNSLMEKKHFCISLWLLGRLALPHCLLWMEEAPWKVDSVPSAPHPHRRPDGFVCLVLIESFKFIFEILEFIFLCQVWRSKYTFIYFFLFFF